ncbi:MAG: hypothetical protein WDN08_18185 [Rhizomicrobium sp.]
MSILSPLIARRFSEVFFVDSSSVDAISADLKTIALAKAWGDTPEAGKQGLSLQKDRWLLVFNNADDVKINLRQYFPIGSHGEYVITSRNRETSLLSPRGHCQVPAHGRQRI